MFLLKFHQKTSQIDLMSCIIYLDFHSMCCALQHVHSQCLWEQNFYSLFLRNYVHFWFVSGSRFVLRFQRSAEGHARVGVRWQGHISVPLCGRKQQRYLRGRWTSPRNYLLHLTHSSILKSMLSIPEHSQWTQHFLNWASRFHHWISDFLKSLIFRKP